MRKEEKLFPTGENPNRTSTIIIKDNEKAGTTDEFFAFIKERGLDDENLSLNDSKKMFRIKNKYIKCNAKKSADNPHSQGQDLVEDLTSFYEIPF